MHKSFWFDALITQMHKHSHARIVLCVVCLLQDKLLPLPETVTELSRANKLFLQQQAKLEQQLEQKELEKQIQITQSAAKEKSILQAMTRTSTKSGVLRAIAQILDTDIKRVVSNCRYLHDTKSKNWQESIQRGSALAQRVWPCFKDILTKMLSHVKCSGQSVPLHTILKFFGEKANPVPGKMASYHHLIKDNKALQSIRETFQSAIKEGRYQRAKVTLTQAIGSFDEATYREWRNYFEKDKPVCVGDVVICRRSADKRKTPLWRRNYSLNSRRVMRGTVVQVASDRKTLKVEFACINKCLQLEMRQVRNADDVFLTRNFLSGAKKYHEFLGVGVPPLPADAVEYRVISTVALEHFLRWIFNPQRVTVLKARGNDGENGNTHRLNQPANTSYPSYKESATSKNVARPLSRKFYVSLLKTTIFKSASAEECACAQCVDKGWQGIEKLGKQFIAELDSLSTWPRYRGADGKDVVRATPGSCEGQDLIRRLAWVWDFLRVEYSGHLEDQSPVGSHCMRCMLSSRCNEMLSSECEHIGPPCATPLPAEYDGAYDAECASCGRNSTTRRGKLASNFFACTYCSTVSCGKCIRKLWGNGEQLSDACKQQGYFICHNCSRDVEGHLHWENCSSCNQVAQFKMDCLAAAEATQTTFEKKQRFRLMATRLVRNIELFQGHMIRDKKQSLFWGRTLQRFIETENYTEAIIMSDFWRVFDGTYLRRINCDSGEKQSVETHVVWSLCPPLDKLSPADVLKLSPDTVKRLRSGERVFLVTHYHLFSNDTSQSSHQAFCNWLSLLETHKLRHPWVTSVGRQTDGCYTYECLKVSTLTNVHTQQ